MKQHHPQIMVAQAQHPFDPSLLLWRKIGLSLLCVWFACTFLSAQAVGERCDQGNCDKGLHCVQALDPQTDKVEDFCCECTQSQLDARTKVVNAKCKWHKGKPGQGWSPNKNPTYLQYVSDEDPEQDRVAVVAFDELLEESKACEKARADRDNACWGGGNAGHKKARDDQKKMNINIADKKEKAIKNKTVYYSSKSTYESAMRAYNAKCRNLRLSSIERDLEKMDDAVKDEEEVDCDDLEDYIEDCKACSQAAEDLVDNAFKGNEKYTPSDVVDLIEEVENLLEFGEDLLERAEDEKLCD